LSHNARNRRAARGSQSGYRQKRNGFTLVEIMIVVLIIGILLAIAIPNFVQARESSRAKSCVANLKQIDSAKQQYLMNNNATTFASATGTGVTGDTLGGLAPTYIRQAPKCPAGGTYTTNNATTSPTCSLAGAIPASYGQSGTYPHYLP
jgi:prepilin-type N-terminal cleavage/methylation domain-containing protein